jgi:hypothetical protein
MLKHNESYNQALKIEESLHHHPFWLLHESAKLHTGMRIHATYLILPIPMASHQPSALG